MDHIINDEEFFKKNLSHINQMAGKVILFANFAPFLLALGVYFKIFVMPIPYLMLFTAFTIPFTITQSILAHKCKNQKFVAYFTLFVIQILISFLGANAQINTYISCAIVPFISCLYFNTKLTVSANIFSYIGLLISLCTYGLSEKSIPFVKILLSVPNNASVSSFSFSTITNISLQ